jgi:hypothetical protein
VDAAQAQQPYAGHETRPIKALSDREIADLKAGRGMGLALAAELCGRRDAAAPARRASALTVRRRPNDRSADGRDG